MQVDDNGIKRINKYVTFVIALTTLLSLFIGVVAGMAIKSQKIDEAYVKACRNEQSINDLREIMIRIDENLKFVKEKVK